MIEDKLTCIAELRVEMATIKNDLTDSEEALIEDEKFLVDLVKDCTTRQKEWDERHKICKDQITSINTKSPVTR